MASEAKQGTNDSSVPDFFLCPISLQFMEDPVMTEDGHTFERFAIQEWFDKGKRTSPVTNLELKATTLCPNWALRNAIQEWKSKNGASSNEQVVETAKSLYVRGLKLYHQKKYKDALEWFKKATDKGHEDAAVKAGRCCLALNRANTAIVWFVSATEKFNNPEAWLELGSCYLFGKGVNMDTERGMEYIHNAAKLESGLAMYDLGKIYFEGIYVPQDYKRAIGFLERAANEHHIADAQNLLGICFYDGKGVEKDVKRAERLWELAIAQGHSGAKSRLGFHLYKNKTLQEEKALGLTWIHDAAKEGDAESQCTLAWFYFEGKDVKQDFSMAIELWDLAATQGHAESQMKLGEMHDQGFVLEKDVESAVSYYASAAKNGNVNAAVMHAQCLLYGRGGLVQDEKLALSLLQNHRTHPNAQYELGMCYLTGRGVPLDEDLAIEYFSKAAKQKHALAMVQLAECHRLAKGSLVRNKTRSTALYHEAFELQEK